MTFWTGRVVVPLQDPGRASGTVAALRLPAGGLAPYAAAVAGLGVLLLTSEFVFVWAPIPKSVAWRHGLTVAAGALMVLAAVGVLWRKTVVPSSAGLAALFASWLVLLQVPRIIAAPSKELLWAGSGQLATLIAAGWILFASSKGDGLARWVGGRRGLRMARVLYALALPLFGLHHFVDVKGAAEAVPAWLPMREGWVYVTGAGHVAAGMAILVGIVPRVAATLEAVMITGFVALVHVPGVMSAPADPLQWTMLVVAAAIGGAAWTVALSQGSA